MGFFAGEVSLGSGVYYLQFPQAPQGDGNIFGYYNYAFFPILYHYDLGFEYFLNANDGANGAYLYDFQSQHWWYTSPSVFPNLYDFTLKSWLYYDPASNNPGHYTSNPRWFYEAATGQWTTLTPALTSVNPNSGVQGQTIVSVALAGSLTHWVQGATTASFGANVTVNSLTVNSATSATASITIGPQATLGARTATLTTGAEIVTLTSGFTVNAAQAPTSITFYVAPNGNDSWSGTLAAPNLANTDGPFATFDHARASVQSIVKAGWSLVTVQFRAGTYFLPATEMFTAADSGSATTEIVYQNYPEESPVISGGVRVKNWTNVSGDTWKTTLPASTQYFENLFYNGARRLRPRLGVSAGNVLGTYYRIAAQSI